jgi:hypothetical protein
VSTGLLEKESTGGAIARVGFDYQDAFVLQHLPLWLSQSAFSHVVSEAIGDVEVCYVASGWGVRRVMYEAKNHTLTSTEFWKEVDRFKTAYDKSSSEYVRFALVCRDYNSTTAPLLAKLERLRGVGVSFQVDSVFLADGRKEVIDWAIKNEYRADLAEFVLDHVEFLTYASEHAESAFSGELEKYFPFLDLSGKQVAPLRERCKAHIARSSFEPVYRRDIEADICEVLARKASRWTSAPVRIHLLNDVVPVPYQSLGLAVGGFTGCDRSARTAAEWAQLFAAATGVGEFVKASSGRRCVALDGKQRMSVACLLGYAFGATRGFILQVEHNGQEYRTDVHDRAEGEYFAEARTPGDLDVKEGVVCIGFPTPVGADLSLVSSGSLTELPSLTLDSARVVNGMSTLNLAVSEAKAALVGFRSELGLTKLHLFIKAPSAFAMVLGYRLNAVCTIQLYDWVDGRYVPTALLTP